MYCEKCGNEIKDDEVICTQCGCARNYNKNQFSANEHFSSTTVDNGIKTADDLKRDIKVCKTLAILAVIFCLGIGIIFSFSFTIKLRKILNTKYEDVTNASYMVSRELKKYVQLAATPAYVIFAVMLFLPFIINNK